MDETTEPIIAVIGHPIAGNPTQFALELGLAAVGVDCRVLSVDIDDSRIRDAIVGMHAMSFAGVWVADTSRDAVERWLGETGRGGKWFDFLRREASSDQSSEEPPMFWEPLVLKAQAWPKLAALSLPSTTNRFGRVLFVDQSLAGNEGDPAEQTNYWIEWFKNTEAEGLQSLTDEQLQFQSSLPTNEQLGSYEESLDSEEALLVVVSESEDLDLAAFKNMSLPSRTVMVDLNENSDPVIIAAADHLKAVSEGTFIRGVDVHAKCLSEVIFRLFAREVPLEVLQEAIDEYLAV